MRQTGISLSAQLISPLRWIGKEQCSGSCQGVGGLKALWLAGDAGSGF
jgi:hypothetical protein